MGEQHKNQLMFLMNRLLKIRHLFFYGLMLAVLVFTLKWMQWKFLILDHSIEIYIGMIALFFTGLGIWVATQLAQRKVQTIIIEQPVYTPQTGEFVINKAELEKLNLSTREYEVLQLIVKGHSNADIADELFLSLSTVKTHVSNLLLKMNAKRRTQVIAEAKRLRIVE